MFTALHLAEMSKSRGGPAAEGDGAWKEAAPEDDLDSDLSLQAVPINSIFQQAASIEELHLVQRLFFLCRGESPRAVVFSSVSPREGAEYVCARMAEILASQIKEAVCLMDANLKDPSLHRRYDLEGAFSFPGPKPKNDAEKAGQIKPHNLWVLPAAALTSESPGFSPDRVRGQLSRLQERFRFLLICAPPLDVAPDGYLLGRMTDGVVLVLQAHSTSRATALKVRQNLETYEVRLLGSVLNNQPPRAAMGKYWKARD